MPTIFDMACNRLGTVFDGIKESTARNQDKLPPASRFAIVEATEYLKRAQEALTRAELAYAINNAPDPFGAVCQIFSSKHHMDSLREAEATRYKIEAVEAQLQKVRKCGEDLLRTRIDLERTSTELNFEVTEPEQVA